MNNPNQEDEIKINFSKNIIGLKNKHLRIIGCHDLLSKMDLQESRSNKKIGKLFRQQRLVFGYY
jgi:hypothetical protein